MADDENQEDGEEGGLDTATKKKLIILGGVCLVLIVVSIAGTMVALNMFSGAEEEMISVELPDEDGGTSAEASKGPAIYYPLKPAIIVNFQARGRQRFLQAELTLLVRDESVIQAVENHMPMIRNSLVMLFGGQTYEELQTAEGKEKLQEEAVAQLQALLKQETGQPGVEKVLFTNFVMQ